MAPTKATDGQPYGKNPLLASGAATRIIQTRSKRKTDHSPIKGDTTKRSALSNLTNNVRPSNDEEASGSVVKEPTAQQSVPPGVEDFDRKNMDDPLQVSQYAMDTFNYLKSRERDFLIDDYMPRQVDLATWMRALLVDWMVETQETFELNHETLFLGVKIVDLCLCRELLNKEKLQLLGAAALLIACKYDTSTPPLFQDFLDMCYGVYKHDQLVRMERETLRILKFDMGIPISYRFLRRYARCAEVPMPTLTLARYILELALMNYATISFSDSQMASAVLFMALRMHGGAGQLDKQTWSPTLIHYTGYQLADFAKIVPVLNAGLHCKPRTTIQTIREKYSHNIFHEVAKVPLLTNQELFQGNLDMNESTMLQDRPCIVV